MTQSFVNNFYIELEVKTTNISPRTWVIFIYASTDYGIRAQLWEYLVYVKPRWVDHWCIGGNFNDILDNSEKRGGRLKPDISFLAFRKFISSMGMGEIQSVGKEFTWANNRV